MTKFATEEQAVRKSENGEDDSEFICFRSFVFPDSPRWLVSKIDNNVISDQWELSDHAKRQ